MKNVVVNGKTYSNVSTVQLNTAGGHPATFIDSDEATTKAIGAVLHLENTAAIIALNMYNASGASVASSTIAVANKNLFRSDLISSNTTSQGVTFVKNTDGSFIANGTSTGTYASAGCNIDSAAFEIGKIYTVSSGKISGNLYVQLAISYSDGTTDYIVARNTNTTFTITKEVVSCRATVQLTASGTTVKNEHIYPQVEIGPQATAYAQNSYSTMTYNGTEMPQLPGRITNIWSTGTTVAAMSATYKLAGGEVA